MALPEISRSMLRNGLVLALFAVVTVGSVSLLRQATAERIHEAERAAQFRVLQEILPPDSHDNLLLDSTRDVQHPLLGYSSPLPAYVAMRQGVPTAVILQVLAPDGYSGAIHLLVGVNADGRLAGVRVVSHRETPGLGDRIETGKSDWILGFTGTSLQEPEPSRWAVKRDRGAFDQFVGATITPRAVVRAVHNALQYFDANRETLLATDALQPAPEDALERPESVREPARHSRAGSDAASDHLPANQPHVQDGASR
ncbi:electron transport complex subunit RsxG [Stutzerimonas azotifigens]|uniref:Ion-translocating oxidoreductase complex subunit G n=1 Tax=Stutzerimonas azotifigens TaxID=291995 RepID=A0ABR5YW52_9GAMM|nr:electron transport complex subunit RsxG [Stutzerimonas azotifigens]MBA1272146.1 electron transport complex subunit RsxG [Stutzerimonas azotifigens]